MESAAVMRSFHCAVGTIAQMNSLMEKPTVIPMYMAASKARRGTYLRCIKASESTLAAKSDGVALDSCSQGPLEKKKRAATFPKGFEALVLEVCDETEVAELKLKVGDFEMNLRRNIGATKTPSTPLTPPPVPSEPMVESAPAPSPPAPAPSKATSASGAPFKNVSTTKSPKLIALEASGASGYVLVPSPTVGEFQRGRLRKGKQFPPACKEKCPDQPVPKVESGTGGALGDVIKEGKVIGYVSQFGTQIQVTSDVDGEVLKVLFDEGDAVGYGDPILAVLPFFHDIK